MLIIPELQIVVLQPPRTGTSALKDAVLAKYPEAFLLYRHMEYAGIPVGYERWLTVAQVRNPFRRMESLFKYMRDPENRKNTDQEWLARVRAATSKGFKHWLLHDPFIFTAPGPTSTNPFRPRYNVTYLMREQDKSQRLYAENADQMIRHEELPGRALGLFDVTLPVRGKTLEEGFEWDDEMLWHMHRFHGWDITRLGYAP